eukprot:jgi/Tetstr1/427048/TSEL_017253.t1
MATSSGSGGRGVAGLAAQAAQCGLDVATLKHRCAPAHWPAFPMLALMPNHDGTPFFEVSSSEYSGDNGSRWHVSDGEESEEEDGRELRRARQALDTADLGMVSDAAAALTALDALAFVDA